MAARLVGDNGPDPVVKGDVIPWQAITGLADGLITVRDENTPTPG